MRTRHVSRSQLFETTTTPDSFIITTQVVHTSKMSSNYWLNQPVILSKWCHPCSYNIRVTTETYLICTLYIKAETAMCPTDTENRTNQKSLPQNRYHQMNTKPHLGFKGSFLPPFTVRLFSVLDTSSPQGHKSLFCPSPPREVSKKQKHTECKFPCD